MVSRRRRRGVRTGFPGRPPRAGPLAGCAGFAGMGAPPGLQADCEELLSRFQETDSVRFEDFSALWRSMKFGTIFWWVFLRSRLSLSPRPRRRGVGSGSPPPSAYPPPPVAAPGKGLARRQPLESLHLSRVFSAPVTRFPWAISLASVAYFCGRFPNMDFCLAALFTPPLMGTAPA